MTNCEQLYTCVACGWDKLEAIFDLGEQSPVNNYSHKEKYPLRLNYCNNCTHIQLSHSVNPKILFSDYPYQSGINGNRHFRDFAKLLDVENKSVLDIACNDGSQLDVLDGALSRTGIEPAHNMWEIAYKKGHEVINDFFPSGKLGRRKFDVIIAQNVFAHVPNPLKFLNGCWDLMNDNSKLYIQTSQKDMIEYGQYDTIYHEHISFFNFTSMNQILARAYLELCGYHSMDVHGGSHIFVIRKKITPYQFGSNSAEHAMLVTDIVNNYIRLGYEIIGFGASAKLINLINYSGIHLDYIVDETPFKIGKKVSNYNIDVVDMDVIKEFDKVLWIPTWNFIDRIKQKISIYETENKDYKVLQVFPKIKVI